MEFATKLFADPYHNNGFYNNNANGMIKSISRLDVSNKQRLQRYTNLQIYGRFRKNNAKGYHQRNIEQWLLYKYRDRRPRFIIICKVATCHLFEVVKYFLHQPKANT